MGHDVFREGCVPVPREELPGMTSRRWIQFALGATTGLLVVVLVVGLALDGTSEGDAGQELFLQAPLPPPTLSLTDHTGRTLSLEGLRGRVVAVFFGYTSCPDVCPLTLSHLSRIQGELDQKAQALQVLFVSVDPERDTPERLSRYLESFHPSILALTGSFEEIESQARGFGVGIVVPAHEPGEAYLVDHTARTFLLDHQGRVVAGVPATASYEELRDAVGTLLASERR